ncbi:dihydrolipoyl dehydrogenase family protein [Acetilactobacillus jinshanensis]|uniref:NAD(P)/FAD-dependent oxidoreductase n=1 Tax=Acetilactobacillus jinshanensis TaxID=1720083 RepID=A0A4P6ZL90_9LACO|nr:NAD(P)/FAD-dependent oxidoreductase [Acetilactobacillus jinshanensis]QBP18323.1 NAD(P)/FAD-dependent oxidoreductase [Acetilactobacillus jinshanensis]URL61188.1 NAD(P)/FAD-dependent oxidoreductase [uncultured bacterium]
MNKYDYDVLYIGAGHGTFDGAAPLAKQGVKVGVAEEDRIGGTCPNWGCNAKITLDAPVKLTREQENLKNILNGHTSIDWSKNMKHKHQVIDGLPKAIGGMLKSDDIDILHGHAALVDKHTVKIGDKTKTAKNIVISTGLRPHRLDVPGKQLAHDSKDFLNLSKLPKQIAIVGAGYVAMEFATIASVSGAQVTVLMHHGQALRRFYQPYVKKVMAEMKKQGVKFVPNANVAGFAKSGDHLVVKYGHSKQLNVDYILDASGRIPNVENIGLDKVGVKYDVRKGIAVDDHLRTSVSNIYASGDVIDSKEPKLTPTAVFESTYLMKLFSGQTKAPIDFPIIPTVVFTSPRIAEMGVPVAEAEKSDQYQVVHHDLTADWYRQVDQEPVADVSLVFNKHHQLVGATEVSDKADDAIDTLLPAAELKLNKQQIGRLVYLFPSIASDAWMNL